MKHFYLTERKSDNDLQQFIKSKKEQIIILKKYRTDFPFKIIFLLLDANNPYKSPDT